MMRQPGANSKLNTQNLELLAVLQLADSFFPSGLYTQSHGLESFAASGMAGAGQLEPLLHTYLLHVAGPGDALAARWVVRAMAGDDLDLVAAIDARLEATRLTQEGRLASRRCGGRILLLGADLFESAALRQYAERVAAGQAPGHQAVAMALLAATAGLGEGMAVLVELHTFAVSLIGAAIRLGMIDHVAGQRLLLRARPVLAAAAAEGTTLHWRDLSGFAPQIEIMQFRHAHADVHMFVS
jgi:urease accessory protein